MLGVAGVGLLLGFRRPQLRPLIVWAFILGLFWMAWGMLPGPISTGHFAIVLFFPRPFSRLNRWWAAQRR